MGNTRFVRANELKKPNTLLRRMNDTGETCFITEGGKAKGVLMDVHRYHALMDLVEEAETVKHAKEDEIGKSTRELVSVKGMIKKRTTRLLKKRA